MRRGAALVVVAVVVVGGTRGAGAEEDGPSPRDGERGGEAASLPTLSVALVHGVPFVWPATSDAAYAAAGPWRDLVERARRGNLFGERPAAEAADPGALYLAADVAFLAAAGGTGGWIDAATAYERALREAPDFPDVARAWFLLGQARLALGFGPEAGAVFREIARRFPASPLRLDARLGEAAALRVRGRPREARVVVDAVLAEARDLVRCRALTEAAKEAEPAAAADAWRTVAAECPDALSAPDLVAEYAGVLVRAGEPEAARVLVANARRPGLSRDDDARLGLLAGGLAPDPPAARAEYERVLAHAPSAALALEAKMRLALLGAAERPEAAAAVLAGLANEPAPPALRAAILGEAAEATARAGRFEGALGLLDRAGALGREGEAQAEGRRAEILARWLARLAADGDDAGIAIVYAAHATEVHALGSAGDRLAIARALGRLGLHAPALRLLGGQRDPELIVARAEEQLATGDVAGAGATIHAAAVPADAVERVAARIALAAGDVEAAADHAARTDDGAVRIEVAAALLGKPAGAATASALVQPLVAAGGDTPVRALLVAGAAAAAEGAWTAAADAYRRALAADGPDATVGRIGAALAAREVAHAR